MPGQAPAARRRRAGRLAADAARTAARSTCPWVLNATGRRPNTAQLGLQAVGVATDAQPGGAGRRRCAAPACRTCYAIGDVTNRKNLTPVAIAEGRAVADRLFGRHADACVDLRPRGHRRVHAATDRHRRAERSETWPLPARALRVYEADFKPMRHTFTGRSERCYMKLLVDDASDRVLAVHMIGADAPEIVQSLAVALTAGATKAHFDATVAVHPDGGRGVRADAHAGPTRERTVGADQLNRRRADAEPAARSRASSARYICVNSLPMAAEGMQRDGMALVVDQRGVHVVGQLARRLLPGGERLGALGRLRHVERQRGIAQRGELGLLGQRCRASNDSTSTGGAWSSADGSTSRPDTAPGTKPWRAAICCR